MASIWADKENINKWIREACEANGVVELAEKIKWQFNNRFRNRMGDANYKLTRLRFSAILWNRATPEEKENTTKHETCHLIAFHLAEGKQIKAHGIEWQTCMIKARQNPERCHSVKTNKKTIDVICTTCNKIMPMGLIRARKMKQGGRYFCIQCDTGKNSNPRLGLVEFVK